MKFHEDGTLPKNGEIFVFGSNLAGHHGAGAAEVARKKLGATMGVGRGMTGLCYAIPTKDENIISLQFEAVEKNIKEFCEFANKNSTIEFFVTRVGCQLAGFKDEKIAPIFVKYLKGCDNISFPDTWKNFINPIF